MRMTYDREAGAAYIHLDGPGRRARSVENVVIGRAGKGVRCCAVPAHRGRAAAAP